MYEVTPEILNSATIRLEPPIVNPPAEDLSAEPTIELSAAETAPAPAENDEPFVPQFVPGAAPLRGRQVFDDLGEGSGSMRTMAARRQGESNAAPDPKRAALLQAVIDMDAEQLRSFASGSSAEISSDILQAVSTDAIAAARTYAGNLAKRKQQGQQSSPPVAANVLPANMLTGYRGARGDVAGRKAADALASDEQPQIAAKPLSVRDPGKALEVEVLALSAEQQQANREAYRTALLNARRIEARMFRLPGGHFFAEGSSPGGTQSSSSENPAARNNERDDDETQIIHGLHHRRDAATVTLPKITAPMPTGKAESVSEEAPTQIFARVGDLATEGLAKAVRSELTGYRDSVFATVSAALKFGGGGGYTGRHHRPAHA